MTLCHALCMIDNSLLDKPGWKMFKSLAKREKKPLKLQNQAKLRRYRNTPRHKVVPEIPHKNDCKHSISTEKKNGNHI